MKRTAANNLCSYGIDMLAYLYNEMAPADREKFETHLAECSTCIDEFAELSQSRYPVFEWKKAEFDRLATPGIAIPYKAVASSSWTQKVRQAMSFRPTFAFGTAAAAVFAAILMTVIFFGGSGSDQELAKEVEPTASPVRVVTNVAPTRDVTAEIRPEGPDYVVPKAVHTAETKKPPVRPVKPKPSMKKRNAPIPVLSTVEDDEDDSLRLTDIFDEIGTSE